MIIDLKMKVEDFEDKLSKEGHFDIEEFVNQIAEASRKGLHLVCINQKLVEWFLKKDEKGEIKILARNRAHMIRDFQRINRQFNFVLKNSKVFLHVEKDGRLNINEICGRLVYSVGFKELMKTKFLESTKIVVENMYNDGQFYEMVLEFINKVKPIILVYDREIRHGGGGTTDLVYERLIDERYVVTCICDQDIANKSNEASKIWPKVLQVHEESKLKYIGKCVCTPGNSLENLLSIELILYLLNEKKFELEMRKVNANGTEKKKTSNKMQKNLENAINKSKELQKKLENNLLTQEEFMKMNIKKELNIDIIKLLHEKNANKEKLFEQFGDQYWNDFLLDWTENFLWFHCGRNREKVF